MTFKGFDELRVWMVACLEERVRQNETARLRDIALGVLDHDFQDVAELAAAERARIPAIVADFVAQARAAVKGA